MKKLLVVTDNQAPRIDGIVRFLLEILPSLKKNFDVTILAPDFGHNALSIKQIKIPLSKITIGDFPIAKPKLSTIRKAVKSSDILFLQTISMIGFLAIKYARLYKKPIIVYKHALEWELVPSAVNKPFLSKFLNFLVKFSVKGIYNNCDLIITPSKSIAEKLSWYGIKTKKEIIPVGVDSNVFIPAKNKAIAKESIGLNPKKLVIGFHGRLTYEKGIKVLVRVYRQLLRKYKNLQLILLGDGLDEVRDFSLRKGVIVISGRQKVVPYLQAMDIYCMPSLTETSCLSLIEAMSCGLPVVSTKAGLIPDYLTHDKNGLLTNKKDTYSLYKSLKLLIDDAERRNVFSKAARKTVINFFDWKVTSEKIIAVLKRF